MPCVTKLYPCHCKVILVLQSVFDLINLKNKFSDSQWTATASNRDVLQLSQLMTPLANKVWQPTVPAYHANPFMVNEFLIKKIKKFSFHIFIPIFGFRWARE